MNIIEISEKFNELSEKNTEELMKTMERLNKFSEKNFEKVRIIDKYFDTLDLNLRNEDTRNFINDALSHSQIMSILLLINDMLLLRNIHPLGDAPFDMIYILDTAEKEKTNSSKEEKE